MKSTSPKKIKTTSLKKLGQPHPKYEYDLHILRNSCSSMVLVVKETIKLLAPREKMKLSMSGTGCLIIELSLTVENNNLPPHTAKHSARLT